MAYIAQLDASAPFEEAWWGMGFKFSSPHAGIIHAGGAGSNEFGPLTDPNNGPVNSFLADCGFPSIAIDDELTFGNDTIQTAVTTAKTAGQASYGFSSGKVYLRGGSMGTLTCLNWAMNNPTLVKAIVVNNPATDLAYLHDNNIDGLAASIETAYGGLAGYTAALPTHNPAVNTSAFTGIPILLLYSTNDPYIPVAQVQSFAAATGAQTYSMGDVLHTVQGLAGEVVSNFFSAHP